MPMCVYMYTDISLQPGQRYQKLHGVTGRCVLPDRGAGNQMCMEGILSNSVGPLQKWHLLLTTVLSL